MKKKRRPFPKQLKIGSLGEALLGKKVVIKSLLASQLVYIMSPLPTSSEHLKDVNNLLYQFLWDGKRDKIKRAEMINDYATGGLKMLDIQTFNRALKAKWIQKCLDSSNKGKWKLFLDFCFSQSIMLIYLLLVT